MDAFPIEYHIEIYEESFINDPSFYWKSTTPSFPVSVGDFFEHRAYDRWNTPPGEGERYIVKEIEHIIWEISGSHMGHKLMICLETVKSDKA